ncbi:DUF742 domain-containing protein [Streptomyces sp. NPDC005132]|uniref:DUF742 domain-containing protein n=1 Tax=Streptomyces sp. NPDC005132 TaxID=3154294 RepID=UPI0033A9BA3F
MPSATPQPAHVSRRRRHISDTARPPRRTPEHHGVHRRATAALTRPRYQIELEALVLTTAKDELPAGELATTHRDIRRLCRSARSLAEISATLSLPLGTARLLVTVLAESGLVHIVRPQTDPDGAAHIRLVADVLAGLRRLEEAQPVTPGTASQWEMADTPGS